MEKFKTLYFSHSKKSLQCCSKFSFVKGAGGAFLLLLFFVNFLLAQTPITPDCSWVVTVCEGPQSSEPGDPSPCLDGTACSPVYYYFYLSRNGGGTKPFIFTFRQFNFNGKLNVTPTGFAGTNKALSLLNEEASLACSPTDINNPFDPVSPVFSADANGDFAYEVTSNTGETDITWEFSERRLLFVLAIDVFPGENVIPGNFSWSFTLPSGMACSTSPIVNCDPNLDPKTVDIPPICGSPFQLRFGSPDDTPVPGYPKRKSVPVFATSNSATPTTFNISDLDFLVKIMAADDMAGISIGSGILPAGDVELYKESPGNNSKNQRIYVKTETLSLTTTNSNVPNAGNTLFYILLDGPELESDCATVDLRFTDFRRMLIGNECCQPRAGSPSTIQWAPSPCPGDCPKATLSIAAAVNGLPPMLDACKDLLIDVFISSLLNIKYDEASISLLIKHSGSLAWNSAISSSPTYCGTISGCVSTTIVAPDILRLDFSIDGATDIDLTGGSSNLLVRLGFSSDDGDACIEAVTFSDAVLHVKDAAPSTYCLPVTTTSIRPNEVANGSDDDICTNSLSMKYQLYTDIPFGEIDYITADNMIIANATCTRTGHVSGLGSASVCACDLPNQTQYLTPLKDDDPLNGVTTYDLVLISKHYLGIEPLGPVTLSYTPYRMIAADANKSNSVSLNDVVSLRKLLLGIHSTFSEIKSDQHSYRFVEKSHGFSNAYTPWTPDFPESASFTLPPLGVVKEFYAIKIGDVNESVTVLRPSTDQVQKLNHLGYGICGGKKGAIVEVPVFLREDMQTVAWQTSLDYDPRQISLVDIRWAAETDEYQEQAWHEPKPGHINLLWYDGTGTAMRLTKGTPLFYLKMELLTDVPNVEIGLSDTGKHLSYAADGIESGIQLEAADLSECRQAKPPVEVENSWNASIYPNPSSGQYRFEVTVAEAGNGTVTIFDVFGRQLWRNVAPLVSGYNSIGSGLVPALGSGQYFVQFDTPQGRKTLRFVKN